MKLRLTGFFALVCLFAVAIAQGGDLTRVETRETRDRFAAGSWEFEDLVGTYFLFDRGGNDRVSIDYAVNSARLGIMIYNPKFSGFLRGNTEFLMEGFGGPIFHGPGDVIAGASFFFRYNFIQPGASLVPYVQAGGGGAYTDIAHGKASSDAIGSDLEFNLQAIAGLRFILNPKWSINVEGSYRHISNAGIVDPNYGIDSLGGALGVGFSF
jgi:hypothetical protein